MNFKPNTCVFLFLCTHERMCSCLCLCVGRIRLGVFDLYAHLIQLLYLAVVEHTVVPRDGVSQEYKKEEV